MKAVAIVGGGIAVLAIGGVIGRVTAPTKVVEKTLTVEKRVEVAAQKKEETSVETKTADVRSNTRWRVRYVARPDGTVVTTASGGSGQSTERTARREEAKRETEIRYIDREKVVEKTITKETARANWAFSVGAALRSGPTAVYQGGVSRRLLGPFFVGIYVSTAKEAGAAVSLEF